MEPYSQEKLSNKKIAIFGGAFDPPHVGHGFNITQVLNGGEVDQLWVMPSAVRNDKSYHVPELHRLNLVRLFVSDLFADDPRVKLRLDEFELGQKDLGTAALMRKVAAAYPAAQFKFVIGSELVASLPNWLNADYLRAAVEFLVITRPGVQVGPSPDGFRLNYIVSTSALTATVSSSELRELIASKLSFNAYFSSSCANYIKTNSLYRS